MTSFNTKSQLENIGNRKTVVDSGKYATKAIGRDSEGKYKTVYFQTKMDATEETKTTADESFVIEVSGKKFLLGKNATKNDSDTTKSKTLHKNAIYTSIHQLVNDKDTVELCVGCPLSVYTEKSEREEYEKFILGDGYVDITVNEERKSFKIVSVTALPESSGYVFKNLEKYLGKIVAVVDIGGLNANCCQYEGIDMIQGTDFTYNLGANMLRASLKKTLNKKLQVNLSDKLTEQAMHDRFIKKDPEKSRKIINDHMLDYVDSLREAMKEQNWDVDNLDFVFQGGGSLLLQNEIKTIFGGDVIVSKSAVWDNAEGFAELISL